MGRLTGIIAIEKGIKSRTYAAIGEIHKLFQKPVLFNGFFKKFLPKDDADAVPPPQSQKVQYTVADLLRTFELNTAEVMQVEARKDWTNCMAKGSLIVEGVTFFADAPVSYLLFLEKQLTDFRTMVAVLPTLDDAETWTFDAGAGLSKSAVVRTHSTKKITRPIVLYPATPEHPAQTQLVAEDVISGYWEQEKHSGAIAKTERERMLARVDKALIAVKTAREDANATDEAKDTPDVSSKLLAYLLQG